MQAATAALLLGAPLAPAALAGEFDLLAEGTPSTYILDDASILNKTTKKSVGDQLKALEVGRAAGVAAASGCGHVIGHAGHAAGRPALLVGSGVMGEQHAELIRMGRGAAKPVCTSWGCERQQVWKFHRRASAQPSNARTHQEYPASQLPNAPAAARLTCTHAGGHRLPAGGGHRAAAGV